MRRFVALRVLLIALAVSLQEARTFEVADRLLTLRRAGGLLVFER